MNAIENTTVIANVDIKAGMFVQDDIMCRVESVLYADDRDGVCFGVVDGNGERYLIRRTFEGFTRTFHWTEDDWNAYRAL